MKIGILTFHRSYNNGAILQAYALASKLNEFGADAEIIDFRNAEIEEPTRLIQKKDKKNLKLIAKIIYRYLRHKQIDRFIKKNLPLSGPVSSDSDFINISDNYDRYITGSDQVWNNSHIKGHKCFFLDFVKDNNKKYSYAASIGGDEKKASETIGLYSSYLEMYEAISLRETNIKDCFIASFGNKVRCDVDPVLLLKKEKWEKIAAPRLHKKKYIFMYIVPNSKHIFRFAHDMAKKLGYDLIDNKTSKEYIFKNGIEDFISWIKNAEVIVTNSFHGTAFSLLFEKEFYVEMEADIGFNYRVNQLLESLEVKIPNIDSYEFTNERITLDYANITERLQVLRKESEKYLKNIITK